MKLFVRWRVHREGNFRVPESCVQEVRQVVAERANELGCDFLLSDETLAGASRQLYKLKKRAKGYTLICDTRANIESRCRHDSMIRTHSRSWGPVSSCLPASRYVPHAVDSAIILAALVGSVGLAPFVLGWAQLRLTIVTT